MNELTYLILYVSGTMACAFSIGLVFLWWARVPLQNWIDKRFPKVNKEIINRIKQNRK